MSNVTSNHWLDFLCNLMQQKTNFKFGDLHYSKFTYTDLPATDVLYHYLSLSLPPYVIQYDDRPCDKFISNRIHREKKRK